MGRSKNRLPGDLSHDQLIANMVRVDHAGEYGAIRIYEGQLAVLGKTSVSDPIGKMLDQERGHLKQFDDLIVKRRIRPSALLPFWHVLGFALGAGTALLGRKAAMACTVAVEEVIDQHYTTQIKELDDQANELKLKRIIKKFREEELEHRDVGLNSGATELPGFKVLRGVIKVGSLTAIWLSTRI